MCAELASINHRAVAFLSRVGANILLVLLCNYASVGSTAEEIKILVLPISTPRQYEINLYPHNLIDITICSWINNNPVFVNDTPLLTLADRGDNSLE